MDALKHLDGVKSAKGGKAKTEFIVEVSEKTVLLPSTLEKGIPEKFSLNGVVIEAAGTVAKDGESLVFTARGNGQKYRATANEALSKLVAAGKTKIVIAGAVTEDEAEEGKPKGLPRIETTTATELKEEKK